MLNGRLGRPVFRNSHFAIATHVMAILALRKGAGPATSAELAQSVGTNPAFLRTVIGRLKEAGLIEVSLGKGGGAVIAKDPDQITLLDLYRAVGEGEVAVHKCDPDPGCLVGRNILDVLDDVTGSVEKAVEGVLQETTIAQLSRKIRRRG
jgi:Rrf2 family protein